ncbi:LptF/LptG family permease [Treponema sp. OMZ 840]|uniref:LptF/LptG family permease n=1 Tax=Treponema sp. OMZ 840 TaxID=244313 RepID=UPI003D933B29
MKKFIPVFLGALGFFSLVLLLIDLLTNLWQYMLEGTPVPAILYICLLYLPKAISFSIPLAVLFGAAFTLSSLYAANELTVVFASGISLFRFTLPLLLFSLLLSVAFFFFEDIVTVPFYKKKMDMQKQALNQPVSYDNDRIVVLSEGGFTVYRADYYDDLQKRLYDLMIFIRNPDRTLNRIISADSALWDGDKWIFFNAVTYTHKDSKIIFSEGSDFICVEEPEIFKNISVSVEEVGTAQAREYIAKLKRTGLPYAEESSLYHKKFAFPLITFIAVFLSIGLAGKSRKNILLISLVSCVSAAVAFYVTQMVTMLLAQFGYISPFAGAWFPVFLFTGISIALLRFART